jgi:hypothetical protein
VRGKFGSDFGQRPRLLNQSSLQVRRYVGEAERGYPLGDPLLGVAASLPGQPLGPGRQVTPRMASAWVTVHSLTPSSAASAGTLYPVSQRAWK